MDEAGAEKYDPDVEKRKSPRIEIELSVFFAVSSELPHNFFTGIMMDLSTGGIFLSTEQMLPVGSRLHLSFLMDTRRVEGHAEVCWTRKAAPGVEPGMGLRFLDIPGEDRDLIEFYIRQKKPIG
ncbi:MAG TPA: TIGR02266 family protein [bacterium]|nr:TIGR02266 family protein [bacterium]